MVKVFLYWCVFVDVFCFALLCFSSFFSCLIFVVLVLVLGVVIILPTTLAISLL